MTVSPPATNDLWLPAAFQTAPRSAGVAMRLFCLPYVGGGPASFRAWAGELADEIELRPLQLPGHGMRLREAPLARLGELTDALAGVLDPWLDRPFALYGHSFGALVAFELAHALRWRGRTPMHLLISGSTAPHRPNPNPPIHHLPDGDFIHAVAALGGIPRPVLECRELIELMLPALRTDFAMVDTYLYTARPPLACPITAFAGTRDPRAAPAEVAQWQALTTGPFSFKVLEGDHFFIDQARSDLLASINQALLAAHTTAAGDPI